MQWIKCTLPLLDLTFKQEIFENYHDLIAFGTACLFIEEDKDDIIRFSARHIKEIYITEDRKRICRYNL